jgi:hypothetical protein
MHMPLGKDPLSSNYYMPEYLKKAKFDGMSIAEHYQQGRPIDFAFAGEDTFEAMGVIKKEMTSKERNKILERLKTEGTLVQGTRYPTIYQHSSNYFPLFYNPSIGTGEISISSALALLMKADADEDSLRVAKVAAKENINEIMRGVYFKSIDSNLAAHGQIEKEAQKTKELLSAENNEYADKVMYALSAKKGMITPGFTTSEASKNLNNYFIDNYNKAKVLLDTEFENIFQMSSEDVMKQDLSKYIEGAKSTLLELEKKDRNMAKTYELAIDHHLNKMAGIAAQIGYSKQPDAGEIDIPVLGLRRLIDSFSDQFTPEEHKITQSMLPNMLEGFLAPKHSFITALDNLEPIAEYRKAMSMAFDEGKTEPLINWFQANAKKLLKPELFNIDLMNETDPLKIEEATNAAYKTTADVIVKAGRLSGIRYNSLLSIMGMVPNAEEFTRLKLDPTSIMYEALSVEERTKRTPLNIFGEETFIRSAVPVPTTFKIGLALIS